MSGHTFQTLGGPGNTGNPGTSVQVPVIAAAQQLITIVNPIVPRDASGQPTGGVIAGCEPEKLQDVINSLLSVLKHPQAQQAALHEGHVSHPAGAGALAFGDDVIGPLLQQMVHDEYLACAESLEVPLQQRDVSPVLPRVPSATPIIIHVEVQINKFPHCGWLVVLCFAFAVAHAMRDRAQGFRSTSTVSVEVTIMDTSVAALAKQEPIPVAIRNTQRFAEYHEILTFLSARSGIDFHMKSSQDLLKHPYMPILIRYLASRGTILGSQLSPQHGTLGLSAACRSQGCQKVDTRRAGTQYRELASGQSSSAAAQGGTTAFQLISNCPDHGPQVLEVGNPDNSDWIDHLVVTGPVRTLLQSMLNLADFQAHHVLVTGADRAGLYHETTLLRPLVEWSATVQAVELMKINVRWRTPHILYAPMVTDWSGARLCSQTTTSSAWSTSGWASSSRMMRTKFGEDMLGRLFDEVLRWVGDSKKVFRSYSTLYLQRILEGRDWPMENSAGTLGQAQ